MGRESHRPPLAGPEIYVPGNDRSFRSKPQVHAAIRGGVAEARNSAAHRCTNTMAIQSDTPRQAE